MHKQLVSFLFVVVIVSMLSACAVAPVPMHTPPDSTVYNKYKVNAHRGLLTLQPYPDGTPRYSFRVPIGGGETATGHLFIQTNADTKGLELATDGSEYYNVTVLRHQKEGGSGNAYVIGTIESEIQIEAINKEIARKQSEESKKKMEKRFEAKKELREQKCGEVMNNQYFCFDNNAKLSGHDIDVLVSLLTKTTNKMLRSRNIEFFTSKPSQVGEWYVESVTGDSISVTVVKKDRQRDIIGETVIDLKKKAGSLYYFVRE